MGVNLFELYAKLNKLNNTATHARDDKLYDQILHDIGVLEFYLLSTKIDIPTHIKEVFDREYVQSNTIRSHV